MRTCPSTYQLITLSCCLIALNALFGRLWIVLQSAFVGSLRTMWRRDLGVRIPFAAITWKILPWLRIWLGSGLEGALLILQWWIWSLDLLLIHGPMVLSCNGCPPIDFGYKASEGILCIWNIYHLSFKYVRYSQHRTHIL